MSNWTNRVIMGAAVVVMAPLTARVAIPGGHGDSGREGRSQYAGLRSSGAQAATVGTGNADCPYCDVQSAKKKSAVEAQHEFRETLCGFLELYAGSEKREDGQLCTDPKPGDVEVMIAVLPDPVHTHLALRFDRAVDDLENSAQRLGWRFQKAWLPWSKGDDGSVTDRFQERYVDEQMKEQREEEPGLLLFRPGEARKPLVVLVVGDAPTSGVNNEQFRTAAEEWRKLNTAAYPRTCETGDCGLTKRLEILGPTFSGSVSSLRRLLGQTFGSAEAGHACVAVNLEIAVVSGTTTSSSQLDTLAGLDGNCLTGVSVAPRSFAADLTYVRTSLLQFLDNHLPRRNSGIAELTEEESQFGTQTSVDAQEAASGTLDRLLQDKQQLDANVVPELDKVRAGLKALQGSGQGRSVSEQEKQQLQGLLAQRRELESLVRENRKEIYRQQNLVYFLDGLLGKENAGSGSAPQGTQQRSSVGCTDIPQEHDKGASPNLSGRRKNQFVNRPELLCGTNGRPHGRTFLQLSFPREISLLRKAYQQSGILGFGGGGGEGAPKTQLQLNFGEESSAGDAVPTFSGTEGATSMESRMAQIATTLEKEKISVAVLSATDVLDEIFVARYLRSHAPSVTIVIEDADVLFLRGGSDASLDGVYIVSPYPLIPRNGIWSADADSPLSPSPVLAESQGDKGTVDAVKYLLCGGEWSKDVSAAGGNSCGWKARQDFQGDYLWMDEYEPPLPVARNSDNDYKLEPPVWLSVIGHGGFQPVALVDFDQQEAQLPESSAYSLPRLGTVVQQANGAEKRIDSTHPNGIKDEPLTQMSVCALCLGLLLTLHGWAVWSCRLNRHLFWSYAAADIKPWPMRMTVQVGMGLLGIYALSVLLIHDNPGLALEPYWFKRLLLGMQVVTAVVNGVAAWRTSAGKVKSNLPWIVVGGVSLFFIVVADLWLPLLLGPPASAAGERNFFFFRSAYPLNGASPTLPLFLLLTAIALWVRGRMSKMVFRGHRVPQLPLRPNDFRCPCNARLTPLNQLIGKPLLLPSHSGNLHFRVNWVKGRIGMFSVLLVTAVVTLTGHIGAHSLAWTRFDVLIDVLTFGVATATVHNLLVSFVAWKLLKQQCLTPLKQSPLRWGFNWIKGFSWKRLWTSPDGFSPESQLEYVMRNVEADRRGTAAAHGPSEKNTDRVQRTYKELLRQYESLELSLKGCPAQDEEPAIGRKRWHERPGCTALWAEGVSRRLRDLYTALAKEADAKLQRLEVLWAEDFGPLTGNLETRGYHNGHDPMEEEHNGPRTAQLQRQADEEFVAMIYLSYIRSVLVQIRNRIGTAAGLYILLLWSLTGYPWMNRHGILLQMSSLLGLLTVTAVLIYAEMQKDEILSRTTETEPGKLDGEFITKILSVVGIPALTLLATQFPEFSNLIFSWVEPGLSSMH